ncbi:Chlorophyllase-2-like protein [Drosera capensis]
MDMLDDETKGIAGMFTYTLCKNGKSREPVRSFVAGALVAFLQAYLDGDDSILICINDQKILIPVKFDAVDFRL